jgi:uncharacterized membrane protein required for colicin V production
VSGGVDVILLGFIAGFTFGGYRTGFVRRAAGLVFLALSFVLGAYLRAPIGGFIAGLNSDIPEAYGEMIAYVFVFPVLIAGLHIVTGPVLARVAVNGLTHELDQLLGAVFGFVEAVLILSALIVILDTYLGTQSTLPAGSGLQAILGWRDAIDASTTAHLLRSTTVPLVLALLGPLLPSDVRSIVPVPGPGSIPGLPSGIPGLPGIPTPSPTR